MTTEALSVRQWRQIALITAAATGLFAGMRWLPTGTELSHMDFRVDAPGSIDFCDPSNPQFIPVVAVASPVAMTLHAPAAIAGRKVQARVMLTTASGKPIAAEDLLVVHTERLHLLIVDPSLTDYQHVHPQPSGVMGEWTFAFTPAHGGTYRIFGDFTPAATNRGLYANADMEVAGATGGLEMTNAAEQVVERDGFRFGLRQPAGGLYERVPADLGFDVTRADGGAVELEEVMGAYAHLVAFDETRSGFAHLHPVEAGLTPTDPTKPTLNFKITIPTAGRYVIWAQVKLGGRDVFVPFWFNVKGR